jgi:hypothetical protein
MDMEQWSLSHLFVAIQLSARLEPQEDARHWKQRVWVLYVIRCDCQVISEQQYIMISVTLTGREAT